MCLRTRQRTYREHESIFITATFQEFHEWFTGGAHGTESINPFCIISARSEKIVAVYADYKHFNELFVGENIPSYGNFFELLGLLAGLGSESDVNSSHSEVSTNNAYNNNKIPSISEHVSTQDITMNELKDIFAPNQHTLWMSTIDAHTPLHYDSYGCNIVTQVAGRKRWRLWPPSSQSVLTRTVYSSEESNIQLGSSIALPLRSSSSSSSSLPTSRTKLSSISSPLETTTNTQTRRHTITHTLTPLPVTRVPYEESSVYSTYDPRSPNNTHSIPPAYDFILEEGDILFIPKHFWHFVETLSELSLSVNLWLPVPLPLSLPSPLPSAISSSIATSSHSNINKGEISAKKKKKEDISIKNEDKNNDKNEDKNSDNKNHSNEIIREQKSNIPSDTDSRVVEAATRVIFGALKRCFSTYCETDDIRCSLLLFFFLCSLIYFFTFVLLFWLFFLLLSLFTFPSLVFTVFPSFSSIFIFYFLFYFLISILFLLADLAG